MYLLIFACRFRRLYALITVFKTLRGGRSQGINYRRIVVSSERFGLHWRLLHCWASSFLRLSLWMDILVISPYCVSCGWGCLVFSAVVYNVYVFWLRCFVMLSSVTLLMTHFATYFLSSFNSFCIGKGMESLSFSWLLSVSAFLDLRKFSPKLGWRNFPFLSVRRLLNRRLSPI